jgi:hypothetical protein
LCVDPAEERGRIQVVDEGALPVDLDDGKPLAVLRLQIRVAADVDLAQLEVMLAPELCERRPRTLAEVAVVGVVDGDAGSGYGYSPRVVVASATRCTASP